MEQSLPPLTEQRQEVVNIIVSCLTSMRGVKIKVKQLNSEDVLITGQFDDGESGFERRGFLGHWDGKQYGWHTRLAGLEN